MMWMRITLAMLSVVLSVAHAHAQSGGYPSKPMRWLIPFAPGGGTDVVMRPIAQKMSEGLTQPILYENRGGGGGVIAGELVARAAPDGYTLLVAAVAVMTVNPSLMKMPFDPVRDFEPITKFASVPNILAARAAFGPRTIQEVVDFAKAHPGKLNWASSGTGSAGTLTMELFRLNTGIKITHIPYKGAGPANVALLSNEADLLFANPGVFMPHIKSGRLRPLGVASAKRISVLPEVPTFVESGFPGYEAGSWYGLAAPARTPAAIITRLHAESRKVLSHPEIIAQLATDGASPVGNLPQEFARDIRDDIAKWAKVIKAADIKM